MVLTGWRLKKIARLIGDNLLVGEDAIDLRLGDVYRVIESTPGARPARLVDGELEESEDQRHRVGLLESGLDICINPGDLLLIPTYEHVEIPNYVMGFINLRSYAARAGLQQATALKISPGFRGYPVLELTATRPLCIAYHEPVVQLILMEVSDPVGYNGRYQDQTPDLVR